MRPLYYLTQNLREFVEADDNLMEFGSSEEKNESEKPHLKMIGILIDLKMSVDKIDDRRNLIITEDGLLFRLNQTI